MRKLTLLRGMSISGSGYPAAISSAVGMSAGCCGWLVIAPKKLVKKWHPRSEKENVMNRSFSHPLSQCSLMTIPRTNPAIANAVIGFCSL